MKGIRMAAAAKETVVYGGAFNPPTLAHQAIVQGCVDYAEAHSAEVWLLPSGNRKDKAIHVPCHYRLALLAALVSDVEKRGVTVRVIPTELDRQAPTETCDTVRELQEKYPGRRFVWVFGTDSLASMPTWRGGEQLLHTLPMLIAERDGSTCALPGKNCRDLGVKTGGISSTEVRRRLAAGEVFDELVSPRIKALLSPQWYA